MSCMESTRRFRSAALRRSMVGFALVASLACSRSSESSATGTPASGILGLPITLRVEQRSTTPIPGTGEALSITIDDITRNQVMTTLVRSDKSPLFGPLSLAPHSKTPFEYADQKYFLELVELENSLLGDDFAMFVITDRVTNEAARIEALLTHIAAFTDVRFVRSGKDYDGKEAAAHLRRKLSAIDASKLTAEEFVDRIAARSSLTGDEYRIRLPDGTTLPAAEYFHRELERLAAPPVATAR